MRKYVVFALLVLSFAAGALDYGSAVSLAKERPPVKSAYLKLQDADAQLARTQADPLALKLDLIKARQERDLAEAEYRLALIRAGSEISAAYTRVLDAEAQLELARQGLDLAKQGLQIAELRYEKGGASSQDVTSARINLQSAENRFKTARSGAELARSQLVSLLGMEAGSDALEPAPLLDPPGWDALLKSLASHPDWLKPHQAEELARAAYKLLDPSYASPAQIENARTNMERAAKGAAEAERGLRLRLEQRWNDVAARRRDLELADESLQKARADLEIARKRFEAGLISSFALQNAELQTKQAALERDVAEHALLASVWSLYEAANWLPVEVFGEN
ncbi:TolC family protein [Oceanithermus sp.]